MVCFESINDTVVLPKLILSSYKLELIVFGWISPGIRSGTIRDWNTSPLPNCCSSAKSNFRQTRIFTISGLYVYEIREDSLNFLYSIKCCFVG